MMVTLVPKAAYTSANSIPMAHHRQRLGGFLRHHGVGGVPDALVVDLEEGEVARARAGGQDDVLAGEGLLAAVLGGDLHLALAGQPAASGDVRDLVLLEQEADPLHQPVGDLAGALHRLRHVGLDLADGHAELLGVAQVGDHGGALQQRLGGDAADVEADAAEEGVLHTRRLVSELRGLDRGDVARGPRADDHHVEVRIRQASPRVADVHAFGGARLPRRTRPESAQTTGPAAGGQRRASRLLHCCREQRRPRRRTDTLEA
jgi:hypothetical protein